jgi:dephospho-CoA kinase
VGYQKEVDITVLVYVDQQTQLKRLIARDHLSENDAYMRINSQMSLEEKKAHADVILDNRSDTQQLEKQIISFLNSLKHEE